MFVDLLRVPDFLPEVVSLTTKVQVLFENLSKSAKEELQLVKTIVLPMDPAVSIEQLDEAQNKIKDTVSTCLAQSL